MGSEPTSGGEWFIVYFGASQKEVHRSTKLHATNPNDTAKAKALRAELEAKEHHRAPVVNSEGWDIQLYKALGGGWSLEDSK